MGYTKKETDFWGNEKEVHYDDSGNKVGETKFRETFWGNKVQDHYDASGNKTGETRKEEGLFSSKAVHYDEHGNKQGYSKDDTTFFGNKIQHHYDNYGRKVGKSHYEEGFLGGHKKVHDGEYFKSRSTKEHAGNYETGSYGSGYSDSYDYSRRNKTGSDLGFVFGFLALIVVAFLFVMYMKGFSIQDLPYFIKAWGVESVKTGDFGSGKGKVSFWSDYEYQIEIFVDGKAVGTTKHYFPDRYPSVGTNGTVDVVLPKGTHEYIAFSTDGQTPWEWRGTIEVEEGVWRTYQLMRP